MAGSPRNSIGNVRSDMDTPYPEHLSRLNRHLVVEWSKPLIKTRRNVRSRNRFRTQPVTFDEIQEVDEDISKLETKDSGIDTISSSPCSKLDMEIYKISKTLETKLKAKESKAVEEAEKKKPEVKQDKTPEKFKRADGREGSV